MPVFVQFDEFRHALSARLNAELIMSGAEGSAVHSLEDQNYQYDEESRGRVIFTLLSAPDQLVTFNLQNTISKNQAFLCFPLKAGEFYFNSILLNDQQVGLSTHNSGSPLSICVPADCPWMIVSFETDSRHLNLMSSTTMPVSLASDRLEHLRSEIVRYLSAGQSTGTPVLDQVHLLLEELKSVSPPLRPQKSTGRSRLPRKHLVPSVIRVIRNHRSSAPFVNLVARELKVTTHSIISMFKEVTGMSPKKYWLYRKLYLLRDSLLNGEYASVSDAAYSLDMSDLGRMSARYFKLFGEYPSDTLRQADHP